MQLVALVAELLKGDKQVALIIADWLEEKHSSHPETPHYIKKLRKPETLRMGLIFSIACKFGTAEERKWACKVLRSNPQLKADKQLAVHNLRLNKIDSYPSIVGGTRYVLTKYVN